MNHSCVTLMKCPAKNVFHSFKYNLMLTSRLDNYKHPTCALHESSYENKYPDWSKSGIPESLKLKVLCRTYLKRKKKVKKLIKQTKINKLIKAKFHWIIFFKLFMH